MTLVYSFFEVVKVIKVLNVKFASFASSNIVICCSVCDS